MVDSDLLDRIFVVNSETITPLYLWYCKRLYIYLFLFDLFSLCKTVN